MDEHLVEDWTERYRPASIERMEGNESQLRRIKIWLEQWDSPNPPAKRGILLSGPPGVGKTTLAKAIGNEKGWTVIELNASEERNAAAIRKAATRGSQHISLDQFSENATENGKTLILLDEVDHLSGSFAKLKDNTIEKKIAGEEVNLKGDSGGKAELMNLLTKTQQPIIMTCNDPMRLWGSGRNWKTNQNRLLRLAEQIIFKRVEKVHMRKISRRVLDTEGYSIDPEALEELIGGNPGDLRALIRDLQAVSVISGEHIDLAAVQDLASVAIRDSQIDVFKALKQVYKSKSGKDAGRILLNSDKDPDQMISWFTWNNQSMFDNRTLEELSSAMVSADRALATKYKNRAYRSWYWGSVLSAQAAVAMRPMDSAREPFITYPNFLRRGRNGISSSVIENLSKQLDTSKASVREELWPNLLAIHDQDIGGDPMDLSLSIKLGLTAEEHLSLYGIAKSKPMGIKILRAFNELNEEEEYEIITEIQEVKQEEEKKEDTGTQFRLDSF
ncbi:AAA family ATPase [Euryarchaeota archaeon]|nr:AAA family ATPase [Candidatus Thalassarchaeum sp.]MDA7555688.1 AAA family ATPase [Euryarchaeota archaeon]MDB3855198.1 AAA family ATPase [Euryarchaeota archaeon]MDC3282157.1 AAA family ATPase [Euryarchaeota archaeon]